jgi:imidazolonepropionase-like amidohydrolase
MMTTRFALLVVLLMPTSPTVAQDSTATILAGRVLNVATGAYDSNMVLTIRNGVIAEMREASGRPTAGNLIDLSAYTVLPGLIDAHAHLCDNSHMGDAFDHMAYPAPTFGIVGVVNARTTLRAGFTTVRDVSEPFYCDVALRDAIAAGWIEGPTVLASGKIITMTGGHGSWGNWLGPPHRLMSDVNLIADGVDGVRRAVRELIKYRVDVIKVAATGGFGTTGTLPGAASYTVEELAAIVDEARKRGLPVAAHAHGAEGIANAIRAGVTSIEHGTFLDEATIALMKEHDVFLVMDLLAAHYDFVEADKDFSDKALADGNAAEYAKMEGRLRQEYEAGVRIAFGTDAGVVAHGRNAEQFRLLVAAGMTPIDAIRSATILAAELLGVEAQVGSIDVGKRADIIAVSGDPLRDVRTLEQPRFVMKGGRAYTPVPGRSR